MTGERRRREGLEIRWIGDMKKEHEILGVAKQSNRTADT
jgi:hypothetical protein